MKNPFLKKKVKKESSVEKYLVNQVILANGEVRKVKFLDRNGAPDRLVMLPGVTAWVELKSHTGKLRPEQIREHERLRAMGQEIHVIRYVYEVDYHLVQWVQRSKSFLYPEGD